MFPFKSFGIRSFQIFYWNFTWPNREKVLRSWSKDDRVYAGPVRMQPCSFPTSIVPEPLLLFAVYFFQWWFFYKHHSKLLYMSFDLVDPAGNVWYMISVYVLLWHVPGSLQYEEAKVFASLYIFIFLSLTSICSRNDTMGG